MGWPTINPQLGVGTAGRIRTHKIGNGYRAIALYRDYDGGTRQVERKGRTKGAAERALAEAIRDRSRAVPGTTLTPTTKVAVLAEAWWTEINTVERSPGTLRLYRDRLDRQIIPALGKLRLAELTVGTVDRHLRAVTDTNGIGVAKAVRSVLSGMCRLACTHDAIDRNPVRDANPLHTTSTRTPRSLIPAEVADLRAFLADDPKAITRDLPDLVDMMLATGLRIGETAALQWTDIDLTAGTAHVGGGIVVRTPGKGLSIRTSDSSKLTARTLALPTWATRMLTRRQADATNDLVFPSPKGNLRDPSNTSADLKEAFTTAGYAWATSHTLRRTVATLIDAAGYSARTAADQLGHAKPSMTADRYMNRDPYVTAGAAALESLGGDSLQ